MYTKPRSFYDLKAEQLSKTSTFKLTGIPIDFPENAGINRTKGLFPIEIGCLCVQDSPENPCPCKDRPPIIVWLPEESVFKSYKSDKLNHDGRELTVFEMDKDATIFVEKLQPVHLRKISGGPLYKLNGNGSGSTPPRPGNNATALIPVWWHLAEAFHLGVWIGETIDEATGLSDLLAGVDNKPHWEKP